MKKIIIFFCLLFSINNLFGKNYKVPSSMVLGTFVGVFEDLEKITDSEKEKESKKLFIVLKDIFSLSLNISTDNFKVKSDIYKNILENLIINFFELLDIDKQDNSYLINNSKYISLLKKYKPEDRVTLIKEILNSVDKKIVELFIKEIFTGIDKYLNKRLDEIIHNVKIKLKIYFNLKNLKLSQESIEKNKKTDQIFSVIFGALATACVQSSQVINAQNSNEKEQAALNLLGTAFNLAGQIIQTTSHHTKDKNINLLLVNLILGIYNQNYYNISNSSYLYELNNLKTDEQRANWLVEKFSSNDFAKKLIKELISCFKTLLHDQIDDVLEYLSDKLVEYFFPQENSDENENKLSKKSFL